MVACKNACNVLVTVRWRLFGTIDYEIFTCELHDQTGPSFRFTSLSSTAISLTLFTLFDRVIGQFDDQHTITYSNHWYDRVLSAHYSFNEIHPIFCNDFEKCSLTDPFCLHERRALAIILAFALIEPKLSNFAVCWIGLVSRDEWKPIAAIIQQKIKTTTTTIDTMFARLWYRCNNVFGWPLNGIKRENALGTTKFGVFVLTGSFISCPFVSHF